MSFIFVTVTPTYLNFSSFSIDKFPITRPIFWFCITFRWRDVIRYLIFSEFTSKPMSLLVFMYMYIWGFRARHHLRSIASVINDYGWLWWPNYIRGPCGLKLPDICLTGEEKPRKTSPRKLVPTGDRNRARCVTGAHATAWPKAVDVCFYEDFCIFPNDL